MFDHAVIHGCLVAINGSGILIVGDSGIGKTSVCLELMQRGHNFIADDAVLIRHINNKIIGSAPQETIGLVAHRDAQVTKLEQRGEESSCSIEFIVKLISDNVVSVDIKLDDLLSSIPIKYLEVSNLTAIRIENFEREFNQRS